MLEKEKLESELRLLKESLDMEVITQYEYDVAKSRIDTKISEIETQKEEIKEVEEKPVEVKEEVGEKPVEVKEEVGEKPEEEEKPVEVKEEVEEKPEEEEKPVEVKEEVEEKPEEEEKPVEVKEEVEEKPKEEEKPVEVKEEVEEKPDEDVKEEKIEIKEIEEPEETELFEQELMGEEQKKLEVEAKPEEKQPDIFEEKKVSNKKLFIYIGIILVLIVSGYFFFGRSPEVPVDEPTFSVPVVSLAACSSDDDCIQEGSIGTCSNPGQDSSECKYLEDTSIKLTILNNNCFNCDTGRVLSILNGFFLNIEAENIDIESAEGLNIIANLGINALPAYIFNSSLEDAHNYDILSSSFNKINDNFVTKNTVANSNFYLDREEIPNKLDLIIKQGQTASSKAEENLQEFLDLFEDVVFEKHTIDTKIVNELGINSFPVFLVNNKVKFSGVQSADKIKDNFCEMNELDECEQELTKSLI